MGIYSRAVSTRTEPLDTDDVSLCDTCAHMVSVVDRQHSCAGRLRVMTICVAEHDDGGSDSCVVVDGPMTECDGYEEWVDAWKD